MSDLLRYRVTSQDGAPARFDESKTGYWTPWHIAERRCNDLRAKLEQAEARVAELIHSRQIEKTSMLMRVSRLSETLEAIRSGEFSLPKCQQLADRALGSPVTEAAILRLQAEAVEAARDETCNGSSMTSWHWRVLTDYSARLRQQADEAEKAGGENA